MFSERRKEDRSRLDQPLRVRVLGKGHLAMTGSVIEMSGGGMQLKLPLPVPLDSPIEIEAGDTLFLGEVRYCRAAEEDYVVGLQLMHSLKGLARLEEQCRAFRDEAEPETARATADESKRRAASAEEIKPRA